MLRRVVTPFSIDNQPMRSSAASGASAGRCTCMSAKPGIRYLPWPSMTRAPAGGGAASTRAMRSPRTTTVAPGISGPFIGTTVTFTKATASGVAGDVAAGGLALG